MVLKLWVDVGDWRTTVIFPLESRSRAWGSEICETWSDHRARLRQDSRNQMGLPILWVNGTLLGVKRSRNFLFHAIDCHRHALSNSGYLSTAVKCEICFLKIVQCWWNLVCGYRSMGRPRRYNLDPDLRLRSRDSILRKLALRKTDRLRQGQRNWFRISKLWVLIQSKTVTPLILSLTSGCFCRQSPSGNHRITYQLALNRIFWVNLGYRSEIQVMDQIRSWIAVKSCLSDSASHAWPMFRLWLGRRRVLATHIKIREFGSPCPSDRFVKSPIELYRTLGRKKMENTHEAVVLVHNLHHLVPQGRKPEMTVIPSRDYFFTNRKLRVGSRTYKVYVLAIEHFIAADISDRLISAVFTMSDYHKELLHDSFQVISICPIVVSVLSLQELSCRTIVDKTTIYGIEQLPLPPPMRTYLKSYSMTNKTRARMQNFIHKDKHRRTRIMNPNDSPPMNCRKSCTLS